MTLTPEQVVASCQRAGIADVFQIGSLLFISEYEISATVDACPGSALLIVAVSRALANRRCSMGYIDGKGVVRWLQRPVDSFHTQATDDALTAACMAAIVAAYPGEVAP